MNDLNYSRKSQAKNSEVKNNYKSYNSKLSVKDKIKQVFKIPNDKYERWNLVVRKNAHAFEYFVLAVITGLALFSMGLRGRRAIVYIMFICLLYAVTDEFHQAFVPGRTSLVSDVLIDFSGSIIGIIIFYVIYYKLLKRERHISKIHKLIDNRKI